MQEEHLGIPLQVADKVQLDIPDTHLEADILQGVGSLPGVDIHQLEGNQTAVHTDTP